MVGQNSGMAAVSRHWLSSNAEPVIAFGHDERFVDRLPLSRADSNCGF